MSADDGQDVVIDLTDRAMAEEDPAHPVDPAEPDLIDLVEAANQPDVVSTTDAADHHEPASPAEESGHDRFAHPARQDECRARAAALRESGFAEPGPDAGTHDRDGHGSEGDEATAASISAIGQRRHDEATYGESVAQMVGRSRGQALLARVLQGHSDSEAAINAHRAVRTATRARQWAKVDRNAMPLVALNLVEALVTRADVLVSTGHDDVARSDLRRAGAVAEQLWLACPSPTTATAEVLVALRSASLDAKAGLSPANLDQLGQAWAVLERAVELELALPGPLGQAATLLDPATPTAGRDRLVELGDRLLDHLQAQAPDPDQVAANVS